MSDPSSNDESQRLQLQRVVLGYLNFSSGSSDGKFLRSLSELFQLSSRRESGDCSISEDSPNLITQMITGLQDRLGQLASEGGAFADAKQAEEVLEKTLQFHETYHAFHQDILWSCPEQLLWQPFFLGRVFETVLASERELESLDTIRDRFDDYIGYRPIAVLETDQKIEPYRNEWVRPIPLYIEEAGVAPGVYQELISQTLEILRATEPDLLRAASFDPSLLEEMSVDPRAYDFDHPVHKRPNHHFGQWDPNRIDQKGFYRRFVLQPVVLSALMERLKEFEANEDDSIPRSELLYEAAAVMAGTILMASGISGSGPNAHSSEETLSSLLPHIAAYRDRFYQDLIEQAEGPHAERLREEAIVLRQPFAGARQHLNHEISRLRAIQLQKVQLARLFARMGRPDAALEQASEVRVTSARMQCEIYCRLTAGHQALDGGDLEITASMLPEIESLLKRGIGCGAFVDPWNIVGFGGNFSLFPAIENTVRDYRVDDLIQIVEQILALCSRAWTEAAAIDDEHFETVFSEALERLSTWWDQFATPMVSGIRRLVAKEVEVSTNLVAGALNAWHKAGAASGDIAFWGMFVDQFDSPKAFQLVIEALLEKQDYAASMALLMRWLCQAELTPLEDGEASFHTLAERWILTVESIEMDSGQDHWDLIAKFFDHLEANAEHYWDAPQFELGRLYEEEDPLDDLLDGSLTEAEFFEEDELYGEDIEEEDLSEEYEVEEEEDELGLFGAAYDEVTYVDSTDDGVDAPYYEPTSDETRIELEEEAQRLESRLAFLKTVAKLWKHASITWGIPGRANLDRREKVEAWLIAALQRSVELNQLLEAVYQHRLSPPGGDHDSLVEFDRIRSVKDAILEGVIETSVEVADARRIMRAVVGAYELEEARQDEDRTQVPKASGAAVGVLRAILCEDREGVTEYLPKLKESLLAEELLYVPISNGGDPRRIARVRALHCLLKDLLTWLPRLGMIAETSELMAVAQEMETKHPVGRGAVTEYDRLFETGYEAIVRCLVASANNWGTNEVEDSPINDLPPEHQPDGLLVQSLQDLTEHELERWLRHSQTVRLSVVERLSTTNEWEKFIRFIDRYGEDIFTQRFLTLSNLRAIVHQGVGVWLDNMKQEEGNDSPRLIKELDSSITRDNAIRLLSLAIESIIENYREYRDYNTTTTQSDHGELLYTLIDFLRLRNGYDRVSWKLKPVYLAHRILINSDRPAAAELWRRAVAERTTEAADAQQQLLQKLIHNYGVKISAVCERIAERFVRPLAIDRIRSHVRPSMDSNSEESEVHFAILREEIAELMETPTGAGLDMPDWIHAIEEEVDSDRIRQRQRIDPEMMLQRIEQVRLDWQETSSQITAGQKKLGNSDLNDAS